MIDKVIRHITKILIYMAGLIVLTSCFEYNLVQSGGSAYLTIRVLDTANKPVPNSKINITPTSTTPTIWDSTNSKGELKVQLVEGDYSIRISAFDGLVNFENNDGVQIIGGVDKVKEYHPFYYNGYLGFKLLRSDKKPAKGITVCLASKIFNNSDVTLDESLKYKYREAISDDSGYVKFEKIPLNYAYGVFCYLNKSTYYNYWSTYFQVYETLDYYNLILPF